MLGKPTELQPKFGLGRLFDGKAGVKQGLASVVAVVLGVLIGVLSVSFPLPIYLLALVQVLLIAAWWFLRLPQWTAVFFWVAFAIQTTILGGTTVRGLYYPIYLMMLMNAGASLFSRRVRVHGFMVTIYLALYVVFVFSLFNTTVPIDFYLFQDFFILGMGLLVLFQFSSRGGLELFMRAQLWAGVTVAFWTIFTSFQGGVVSERGAIGVDENYATTIIALGLIPLIAAQLAGGSKFDPARMLFSWLLIGIGVYALLILASRGITIAFAVTVIVMFLRMVGNVRRSLPLVVLGVIAALVLATLPGSENLIDRFAGSDVTSANGRTPLWLAGIAALRSSSPVELLIGSGFGYSRVVTSQVVGFLYSIHNAYLQLLLEVGFVGTALFLLLHFIPLHLVWRYKDALSLHTVGSIIFILLVNLTLTFQEEFPFWVVLGYCLAVASYYSFKMHDSKHMTEATIVDSTSPKMNS